MLEDTGIQCITTTGEVYRNNRKVKLSVNKAGYYFFTVYKLDNHGNRIKKPIKRICHNCKKETDTYVYATRAITLHRGIWAWYNDIVPAGYVVDHKNNRHCNLEDYDINNLQLLTPKQNLAKEQKKFRKEKMPKYFNYEKTKAKLAKYELEYAKAKLDKDQVKCHKLRCNISMNKSKIAQYEADPTYRLKWELREQLNKVKNKVKAERKDKLQKIKELQQAVKIAHCNYTNNPNKENCEIWRNAIKELNKVRN